MILSSPFFFPVCPPPLSHLCILPVIAEQYPGFYAGSEFQYSRDHSLAMTKKDKKHITVIIFKSAMGSMRSLWTDYQCSVLQFYSYCCDKPRARKLCFTNFKTRTVVNIQQLDYELEISIACCNAPLNFLRFLLV